MAKGFNLTAQINLRGPNNIGPVISKIKRELSGLSANVKINIDSKSGKAVDAVRTRVDALNQSLVLARQNTQSLNSALSSLTSTFSQLQSIGSKTATTLDKTSSTVGSNAKNITVATTQIEEFGKQSRLAIKRFAAFSIATSGVVSLISAIDSGFKAFIKFDRELVKLQQVTGNGAIGIKNLENEITRLAISLGVSSESLVDVATILAQAGFNAEETRISLSALAKTELAPSFDDIKQTTEGAIAAFRQFGLQAQDLEGVLGSINAVAAAFAVESSDIIAAIQRTGGVFAAASKGVSQGKDALNEFIAVFTSVRATTRESAETIATGLRTIFTRIQRARTIDLLKQFGVELTDLEGKFVGPFEAIKRLSSVLNQLDPRDLRFSSIVEELGGFRQIGKVIPLIQQFSTAQQALTVAQKGQNSLSEAQAIAQKSLANQIAKVREQFLALIRDVGKSSVFQGLTKIVLGLTSGLISLAGAFKPILPLLGLIGAVKGASAITQFATGFFGGIKRGGGAKNVGDNIGSSISGASERDRSEATTRASEAIRENTSSIRTLTASINQLNQSISSNTAAIISKSTSTTLNSGGKVMAFARGGVVPGSGNRDTVPAMLQPGEFVIRKKAVETIGSDKLHKINKFARGGTARASMVQDVSYLRAQDGDSLIVDYTPKSEPFTTSSRLLGYDAYEIASGSKEERAKGEKAKEITENWASNQSRQALLEKFSAASGKKDKYGRPMFDAPRLGQKLVSAGVAVPYSGSGKKATGSDSFGEMMPGEYEQFYAEKKLGGLIKRFAIGGTVEDIAQNKNISIQDAILQQVKDLGGISGVKSLLGASGADRTYDSILRASNIGAGKNIPQATKILNDVLAKMQREGIIQSQAIDKATKVGVVGLQPFDFSDEDGPLNLGGKSIFMTIRGLSSKFANRVAKMRESIENVVRDFASGIQQTEILGGGEQLRLDFDETLVSGADIFDSSGAIDISGYSDLDKVKQALSSGRLTELGQKIKEILSLDPSFIDRISVLTARPQSNAELLSKKLNQLGLPIPTYKITGTSGGGKAKADALGQTEKLIDDNLDNIRAAKSQGKNALQYAELRRLSDQEKSAVGFANIEGSILEATLAALGARGGSVQNRAIDYENGLGPAAQYFPGIGPDWPTEVKRTLDGSSLSRAKEEFARYFKDNANAYKLGGEVYDLEKGSGFSSREFNALVYEANTNDFSLEEFKKYLEQRIAQKKAKANLMMNPIDLLRAITPERAAASQKQMDLARSLMGTPDAQYNPKYDNARSQKFEDGGAAQKNTEKQFGKIGLKNSGSEIVASYFKNNTRSGMVSAKKSSNNLYTVALSAATKGYGPKLYDIVMEAVTANGGLLTSDRNAVSDAARSVWAFYFNNRTDVKKTPLDPSQWTKNSSLIDPKLSGPKDTWPPPTDSAWVLQSGYSKNPDLINGPDIVNLNDPKYAAFVRQQQMNFLSRNRGGSIRKFANGGSAEDTVPALLTPGEFVINKKAAQRIGYSKLEKMNQADKLTGYNNGGIVGGGIIQRFAEGGEVDRLISRIQNVLSVVRSQEANNSTALGKSTINNLENLIANLSLGVVDFRDGVIETANAIKVLARSKASTDKDQASSLKNVFDAFAKVNNIVVSQKTKAPQTTTASAGDLVSAQANTEFRSRVSAKKQEITAKYDPLYRKYSGNADMQGAVRAQAQDEYQRESQFIKEDVTKKYLPTYAASQGRTFQQPTSASTAASASLQAQMTADIMQQLSREALSANMDLSKFIKSIQDFRNATYTQLRQEDKLSPQEARDTANQRTSQKFNIDYQMFEQVKAASEAQANAQKLAAEEAELFAAKAKSSGLSLEEFTAKIGQNVLERAKNKEDIEPRRESFRLAAIEARGQIGRTSDPDKIASIMDNLGSKLQELIPSLDASKFDQVRGQVQSGLSESKNITEIINSIDVLKKAFNEAVDPIQAMEEAAKETAEAMGISAEAAKKAAQQQMSQQQGQDILGEFGKRFPDLAKKFAGTKIGGGLVKAGQFANNSDVFGKTIGNKLSGILGKNLSSALGGQLTSLVKGIGGPISAAGAALTVVGDNLPKLYSALDANFGTQLAQSETGAGIAGGVSGAGTGAASGAVLLSWLGPPGVLIGGITGALIGGINGFLRAKEIKEVENALERLKSSSVDLDKAFKEMDLNNSSKNIQNAEKQFGNVLKETTKLESVGLRRTLFGGKTEGSKEALSSRIQQASVNQANAQRLGTQRLQRMDTATLERAARGEGGAGSTATVEEYQRAALQAAGINIKSTESLDTYSSAAARSIKARAQEQAYIDAYIESAKQKGQTDEQIENYLRNSRDKAIGQGRRLISEQEALRAKQELMTRAAKDLRMASENLLDVFKRITAGLQRLSDAQDNYINRLSNGVGDLTGDAKIGDVDRTNEQILANPSAFSLKEIQGVANNIAGLGGGSDEARKVSNNLIANKVIQDQLPAILRETDSQNIPAAIDQIRSAIETAIPDFDPTGSSASGVNEILSQIESTLEKNAQSRQGTGLDEIAEQTNLFDTISKTAEEGAKAAAAVQKTYNDTLQKSINLQNQATQKYIEAAEWARKSSSIRLNAEMELKRATGQRVSLTESNNAINSEIASMTGGLTDPTAIANQIRRLTEINNGPDGQGGLARSIDERRNNFGTMAAADPAQAANLAESLKADEAALRKNKQGLIESTAALKRLAEDGTAAANALSLIQENQKIAENAGNVLERLATADQEELNTINRQVLSATAMQNGTATPQQLASRSFREDAFAGQRMLAELMPEEAARQQRANALRQIYGGDLNKVIGQTTDKDGNKKDLTVGEAIDRIEKGIKEDSPEVQAYKEAVNKQAEAANQLARISSDAADRLLSGADALFAQLKTELPEIIKTAFNSVRADAQAAAAGPPDKGGAKNPATATTSATAKPGDLPVDRSGGIAPSAVVGGVLAAGAAAGVYSSGAVGRGIKSGKELVSSGAGKVTDIVKNATADSRPGSLKAAEEFFGGPSKPTDVVGKAKSAATTTVDMVKKGAKKGKGYLGSMMEFAGGFIPKKYRKLALAGTAAAGVMYAGASSANASSIPIGMDNEQNTPPPPPTETKAPTKAKKKTKESRSAALDWLQTGLDVAGLIPIIGEAADLANAGIYAARAASSKDASVAKDLAIDSALSAGSAIPFGGYAATAVKAGRKVQKAVGFGVNAATGAGIRYAGDSARPELVTSQPIPSSIPKPEQYTREVRRTENAENRTDQSAFQATTITIDENSRKFLETFNTTLNKFGEYVNNLSSIKIPEKIEMTGNHNLKIEITGAAAIEGLEKASKDWASALITNKLKEFRKELRLSLGDAVKDDASIGN